GATSAIVIAQDRFYPMPVRLDVMFDRSEGRWTLSAMSARLCDPSKLPDPVAASLWKRLWDAQRIEALADLASAAHTIREGLSLGATVDDKRESPIAA